MVEWRGVEPETPEALAKAREYEPPPTIKEPGEPQATTFSPPPEGKVVEEDVGGRPTVYVTPDGVRHYTPQSTMWEKGYKTDTEYRAPGSEAYFDLPRQATTPPPHIAVTTSKGESAHIPRTEAKKVRDLTGERQFLKLVDLGVIEKGSKFIPDIGGYEGKGWTYIPKGRREELKGFFLAGQVASRMQPGADWIIKGVQVTTRIDETPDPLSPANKFAEGGTLNLTEAIKAGYTNVGDYAGWEVTQSQINALAKEQKDRDDALKVLAGRGYKGYGDRYRVVDALVSDDPKVINALGVVFSEQDLSAAQKWIDRHWGAHGRFIAGKEIPFTKEIQKALRKLTPWQEGKGETLLEYLQRFRRMIPVPSPLAAVVVPVTVTPFPHDDAVLWVVIGGAVAAGAIITALRLGKDPAVPKELAKATAIFRSQFKRSPIPEDLVLVTSQGMAIGVKDIDPAKKRIPGVSIVPIDPKIPALFPRDLRQQIPGITITKIDPKIPPISTKKVEPALYLPTPMITMDELTGLQAGMIKAVAEVAVAEKGLKAALPSTKTIPIDWDKILADAQKAKTKEDIQKVFSPAFTVLPKVAPDVSAHFHRNYQVYLRRMAILNAATQSYVASLNPTPVMGKASDEAMGIVASYMFAKTAGLAKPKAGEVVDAYVARVLGAKVKTVVKLATATAITTLTRALTEGLTATQAATQAVTATQTAILPAVNSLTQSLPLTQTQVLTLSQALAVTAAHTAVATAVATGAMTNTMATTATATLTTIYPAVPKLWLPRLPKIKKPKVKKPRSLVGVITWKPHKYWYAIYPPYKTKDDVKLLKKPPKGARVYKGVGSALKTIQSLGVDVNIVLELDLGIQDVTIRNPRRRPGRKGAIKYKRDLEQRTRGDISLKGVKV